MAPKNQRDGATLILSKRVRILLAVLAVLALGGGGFYLFGLRPQAVDTLTLYGNVDIREVQLAFKSSGQIATMRCARRRGGETGRTARHPG